MDEINFMNPMFFEFEVPRSGVLTYNVLGCDIEKAHLPEYTLSIGITGILRNFSCRLCSVHRIPGIPSFCSGSALVRNVRNWSR